MNPKVGLITTMSPDSTWPEVIVKKVRKDHKKAADALLSLGFDVIKAGEYISRTKSDMKKHGAVLREKGIEVLVLYVGTWTYSNLAVAWP